MISKFEINREMIYSGVIFIFGSILFIQVAVIDEKIEKDMIGINEQERINAAMILLVSYLIFLIGSVLYFDAASQRLKKSQEHLMRYRYTHMPVGADTLAYIASGILLISIIVFIISGLLRVKELSQNIP